MDGRKQPGNPSHSTQQRFEDNRALLRTTNSRTQLGNLGTCFTQLIEGDERWSAG